MRFGLVLFSLLFAATTLWAAPQITAEERVFDFGEVLQGDTVEHVFLFKNSGDDMLRIESVHSSCGCTAALVSARQVAPGDRGELRITFDSSDFRNAVHKTITLQTNDPDKATYLFEVKGIVKEELYMVPARLRLGVLAPGAEIEKQVEIKNDSSAAIQLKAPQSTNAHVSASLDRTTIKPGERALLSVRIRVPQDARRVSGYVTLETDYIKVPRLRMSLSARVSP